MPDFLSDLFAAQLGDTNDPTELIPGSPDSVQNVAQTLREYGEKLEATGNDLGNVQIDGWFGEASNSFWDRFTSEPPRWLTGADAMTAAAEALTSHADTLRWAQDEAEEAIRLWEEGAAATKVAQAAHAAAVANNSARNQANIVDCLPGDTPIKLPNPIFVDPGEQLRKDAEERLRRAREQLAEAGDTVAASLGKSSGNSGDSPGWLSNIWDTVASGVMDGPTGDTSIGKDFKEWGKKPVSDEDMKKFGYQDKDGDGTDDKTGVDINVKLAENEWGGSVWDAKAMGGFEADGLKGSGEAGIDVLGWGATASASAGKDGLSAQAGIEGYLAKASAAGSVEYGIAEVRGSVEGSIGAEAEGEAAIGKDGLRVGGEAFIGGKIEGDVGFDVGGVGAGVHAEGWAGAGVAADLDVGMKDGKFVIGGEAGIGFGVGGKIAGQIEIDPGKVIDTVSDAADAVGDAVDNAANAVGGAVSDGISALNPFD